jgi:pimeloyl-ACP methyl ester carboxylesterase
VTKRFDAYFDGADGLRLAAMVRGPVDGPPVLLAHGGGQTHWAWRNTVSALAEAGFRAVAIDLRGHGDSDWSPLGDYHFRAFARDLLAVADKLGSGTAIVGASLGGIAGLLAEGEIRPGSFSSLTLVDITSTPDAKGVARVTGFMAAHVKDGFASPEDAAEVIASYTPNRPKRGPSDSLKRYLRKGDDGRYRWHWDPKFLDSANGPDFGQSDALEDAARALSLPVHLIRGGSSDLVTPESAREFQKQVPHARFTDIAGAGHMVVGDRNDAFGDAIIQFLTDNLCSNRNGM